MRHRVLTERHAFASRRPVADVCQSGEFKFSDVPVQPTLQVGAPSVSQLSANSTCGQGIPLHGWRALDRLGIVQRVQLR